MTVPHCKGCKEAEQWLKRSGGEPQSFGCSKHGPLKLHLTQEWVNNITKSKYHNTEDDYKPAVMFTVDRGQHEQLVEWCDEHDKTCPYADPDNTGAIGGRLTYSFTSTSLGEVCKVECACGAKVDLTEYGDW
jgi:arsenate reductase-like glutaredoxin family protein